MGGREIEDKRCWGIVGVGFGSGGLTAWVGLKVRAELGGPLGEGGGRMWGCGWDGDGMGGGRVVLGERGGGGARLGCFDFVGMVFFLKGGITRRKGRIELMRWKILRLFTRLRPLQYLFRT